MVGQSHSRLAPETAEEAKVRERRRECGKLAENIGGRQCQPHAKHRREPSRDRRKERHQPYAWQKAYPLTQHRQEYRRARMPYRLEVRRGHDIYGDCPYHAIRHREIVRSRTEQRGVVAVNEQPCEQPWKRRDHLHGGG